MQKILIIRFSSIGDIVLTSPVVRCLKQQLDVELHYLCKSAYRPILTANPYIDKVFSIEQSVSEVVAELQKESYDLIIDLHKNIRSAQVSRALKVKRLSFHKANLAKWLLVNFKINRLPDLHLVDRYMAAVQSLGILNDRQGLDYFIPPEEQVDLNPFFIKNNTPTAREGATPFIAFAIGAAHATKRLPIEKITAICEASKLPVVLLGGPGEQQTGHALAAKLPAVINTCGQLSIHQSASVIQQAVQVISHDTGMMHIAAALRRPVISVWGNTVPAFGMYPYYPEGMDLNISVEVEGLNCRPCSKIGYTSCPKGHFKCMQQIDIEQIEKHMKH